MRDKYVFKKGGETSTRVRMIRLGAQPMKNSALMVLLLSAILCAFSSFATEAPPLFSPEPPEPGAALLVNTYLQDYAKAHPVSEADIKAEYDRIKAQLGDKEYKVRHILVEKEEDAKAIIAKLDKGEKFATLAKQSLDPGSKERGGDLDWSSPNAYVPPFGEALTKLKKGEYTKTPVKSDFGYHVIQLDDTRPLTPPSFEEVKPQLQQRASQMQVEKLVRELREKAKVD